MVVEVLDFFLFHARRLVLFAQLVAWSVLVQLGWFSLVHPVVGMLLPVVSLLLDRGMA